jgi:DNA-binding transcriptional ArsR family regulator
MSTFTGDRLSFDDLKTGPSRDGLPPFPDLDVATEQSADSSEQSDSGNGDPPGDSAEEDASNVEDPGVEAPDLDDSSTTNGSPSTECASPQNEEPEDADADANGDGSEPDTDGTESPRAGGSGESGDPAKSGMENAINDTDDTGKADDGTGTATTHDRNDNNDGDDASRSGGRGPDGVEESGSKGLGDGYLSPRIYELLPRLLGGPAQRIADRRKRDVFLTGALPVWAGALPNVRFRYGGSDLSPNLYSATIAPPASGKGALRQARKYGAPLQEELRAGGPATGAAPEDDSNGEVPSSNGEAPSSEPSNESRYADCPRLFLAGDTSAAAIKQSLGKSPHGVICETEFRTLSQALGSSWGKFEDVLLKGFQNETIHMARTSKADVRISHPAPSIALAGTPNTFGGVISGTGDGLFSRFLLYRFDREFEWETQFNERNSGLDQSLQNAAEDFQVGYHELRARTEPLRITVPEPLQRILDRTFDSLTEKWKEEEVPRSLQASLTRSGLQAVKIGTVLRGIRLVESGAPLREMDSAALRPEDMEAGLRLALTYLLHGVRVEARLRGTSGPRAHLTERKRRYLQALPEESFSTREAKALASTFDVSQRNAQRWLKRWREAGLLTKRKRGRWAKLSPEFGGIAGARSVISVIHDIPPLSHGPSAEVPS